MLITQHFVFVHVPKTGGDFVRRLCKRRMAEEWFVQTDIAKHGPDTEIPEEYAHLPRFALVRNPWDWHVSWYHYLMGSGRPEVHRERVRAMNPWFVKLTDDFSLDFATTMKRLYDPETADDFPKGTVVRIAREQQVDLLTQHLHRQIAASLDDDAITVGRMENLRHDFHEFLTNNGVPLSDMFRMELFERPPVNRSRRAGYRTYYDDALARTIGDLASDTVERYGYSFEDGLDEEHDADPATP